MASLAAADDASEKSLQSLFDPDQVGRLSTQLTRQQQEGQRDPRVTSNMRLFCGRGFGPVFPYVILRS